MLARRPLARTSWLVICLLLQLCVPAVLVAADEADAPELDELRRAVRESRERVGGHERQERQFLELVEELDRSLQGLSRRVAQSRADSRRARDALTESEKQSRIVDSRLRETRKAMLARVVALYKAGEVGPVRVLFSSSSLKQILSRISTLQSLVAYDTELVMRYRNDRAALELARGRAERATSELDAATSQLREQQAQLARERSAKRQLLTRVRDDRTQERAVLVELEKATRVLEETLATLGEARKRKGKGLDGSGFPELRGKLPSPVHAKVAQAFGTVVDSEFLTRTFRNGVEFGAPAGDTVRAVARGEVRFAGWFRGYGKIAIVDHGDNYFTVSGHLDEIFVEVGGRLRAGDTIGTVGETGSLAGPSLYFEIRRGGEPLDPSDWLRDS